MTDVQKILNLLEFNDDDIIVIAKLINLLNLFEITDEVKESFFQFTNKYDKDGRCETFSAFYKRMILGDLSYRLCFLVGKKLEVFDAEDFGCYFQEKWLKNETNNEFYDFFLNNDFKDMNKDEIFILFEKQLKSNWDEYLNL